MKLSVSQLSRSIQQVLKQNLGREVWVVGELAGYDRSVRKGGHVYATLCEKDDKGATVAQLSVSLFKQNHQRVLDRIARSPNPFTLEDGREVCFLLRLDYYAPYGRLSGIVSDIDPIHTLEEAKKRRLEILLNLEKAGIKDNNRALSLPVITTRIGLITAKKSAAEADFIGELKNSGYAFNVKICYATMQGKQTEASVLDALDRLYRTGVQAVCITRGGGDVTDLQWFDNEKIARKILEHNIPVFSGIGHEIDRCVIDEIAKDYFKTPTALAQSFVDRIYSFLQVLEQQARQLQENTDQYLVDCRHTLSDTTRSLGQVWSDISRQYLLNLSRRTAGLRQGFRDRATGLRYRLSAGIEKMRIAPFLIRAGVRQLANDGIGLRRGAAKIVKIQDLTKPASELSYNWKLHSARLTSSLEALAARLREADPQQVLKKGYTITTTEDGTPVAGARLKQDEILLTRTMKKTIKSKYMEDA